MQQNNQVDNSILNHFHALLKKERLAHAYLFIGPDNVGKSETALAVAKLVNCDNFDAAEYKRQEEGCGYCDQCPACIKINSGNHPDIFIIDIGEEKIIKIAQIRELINKIQLRAFEAKKKVVIIKNIEHLTMEGSNALLKTLEEPSANSLLILTTAVPERNLGTVKSRCHAVHFFPSSKDALAEQLRSDYSIKGHAAHFLAYFSEGSLGKARRLNKEKFFDKKNEIIDNIIFDDKSEVYIKKIVGDQEKTKEVLDVLLCWFRDLILLKSGVDEIRLVHLDRINELSQLEPRYSFNQLREIVAGIVNTTKQLTGNLNVKIPLTLLTEKIWVR